MEMSTYSTEKRRPLSFLDNKRPKIVVIVGPTASGKTALGISLAKKFNGEIISADSRTVYRGMDIGTAKPTHPHHLIDVVDPDEEFTVVDWKKMAEEAIEDIVRRGKVPIVVGGTGLYVQALVDNLQIPAIQGVKRLRENFEKKSLDELVRLLRATDPTAVREIDLKNKRRVIRALEVATFTGESFWGQRKKGAQKYDALILGIDVPRAELYRRIDERVDEQIRAGFVEEVQQLLKKYSSDLSSMSGIGYGELTSYLQKKTTLPEAAQRIKFRTHAYARRQMTWFRRDARIHWIKKIDEAQALVRRRT